LGKPIDAEDRILDAAEQVLRRLGPEKTGVVDIARTLGMSHANVYRYFTSKQALRDAVAERWLKRISVPLETIVQLRKPAAKRLEKWILELAAAKRRECVQDPEMFAMYQALVKSSRDVVERHLKMLHQHVAQILQEGIAQGEFKIANPNTAATAVLNATIRFHHPYHVREFAEGQLEREIRGVLQLVISGLVAGEAGTTPR
jgi:AcrR family transcriptional regulator